MTFMPCAGASLLAMPMPTRPRPRPPTLSCMCLINYASLVNEM